MRFLFLFLPLWVFAFPENVRHGYGNCTTCHVSPDGGGILTRYGRELSKELQSTWGSRPEIRPMFGIVPLPKWLSYGGDIRFLQLYKNTPAATEAKFFPMQADLEVVTKIRRILIDGTVGIEEKQVTSSTGTVERSEQLFSRRHYINYRPYDAISLRAGKFQQAYGINTSNHSTQIKKGLGWDEGTETYNAEMAYIGDTYSGFLTGIFGRPDDKTLQRETGASTSQWLFLSSKYKLGISFFYGSNELQKRQVIGPSAILGFTEKFVLVSEFDYQKTSGKTNALTGTTGTSQKGFVTYNKLSYEIFQGFHLFGTHEFSELDLDHSSSISQIIGLGFQFFPRPKWEFEATIQKRLIRSAFPKYTDFAYLMIHFYI